MSIQRWTITGGDIAPAEADAAQTDWVRWVDHQAAVVAARADEREWWYAETVSGYDRGVHDAQLAARNDGTLAFAVLRPDGMGPASIGNWPVVITLAAFTDLLTAAQVKA